jgi:hypothetical protein
MLNVQLRMGKVDRPLHSLPAVAGAMPNSTRLRRHYFDVELAAGRVRPLADKGLLDPPHLRKSAKSADDYFPTVAITLSSIAIGVGSALTSTVVRVGLGLPAPAKYSA